MKMKINWGKVLEWGLTLGGFTLAGIGQIIGTHNQTKDSINEFIEKGKEAKGEGSK